jgi:hypothetical protein
MSFTSLSASKSACSSWHRADIPPAVCSTMTLPSNATGCWTLSGGTWQSMKDSTESWRWAGTPRACCASPCPMTGGWPCETGMGRMAIHPGSIALNAGVAPLEAARIPTADCV